MPCMQMRILEREREEEEDRKRKKKLEEEKAKAARKKAEIEKARSVIRKQAKQFGWRLSEIKPNVFIASKTYSDDKITFTVLGNGMIKTVTDEISMANHSNAEGFLKVVAKQLRGIWKIFHRHGKGEMHSHAHHHHA